MWPPFVWSGLLIRDQDWSRGIYILFQECIKASIDSFTEMYEKRLKEAFPDVADLSPCWKNFTEEADKLTWVRKQFYYYYYRHYLIISTNICANLRCFCFPASNYVRSGTSSSVTMRWATRCMTNITWCVLASRTPSVHGAMQIRLQRKFTDLVSTPTTVTATSEPVRPFRSTTARLPALNVAFNAALVLQSRREAFGRAFFRGYW